MVSLMGGGSQTLAQEAKVLNKILDSQMGNSGGPLGVTPFVTTATRSGITVLALVLVPDNAEEASSGGIKIVPLAAVSNSASSSGNSSSNNSHGSSNLSNAALVGGLTIGATGLVVSLKLVFIRPPLLEPGEDSLAPNAEWLSWLFW
jgi:hypothetical protein